MLIHSFGFTCPVPYEMQCLTYESAWHLDLCKNVPCLPLQQNNTLNSWKKRHLESLLKFTSRRPYKAIKLNIRRDFARGVIFKNWPPSTLQSKRLNKCRKLTCGVIFEIYNFLSAPQSSTCNIWTKLTCWVVVLKFECTSPISPPSLLNCNAQHINQFGILSHCYVFPPLSPTKTQRPTYKTTWHHEPCLRCLFLPLEIITLNIWTKWNESFLYSLIPSPTASQYVEHVKNISIWSHFWNLSPSTLQSNRFSIWVIVIDLTPPLQKRYFQHMNHLGILSHVEHFVPPLQNNALSHF